MCMFACTAKERARVSVLAYAEKEKAHMRVFACTAKERTQFKKGQCKWLYLLINICARSFGHIRACVRDF